MTGKENRGQRPKMKMGQKTQNRSRWTDDPDLDQNIFLPLSLYLLFITYLFYLSLVLKVEKIQFPTIRHFGFND